MQEFTMAMVIFLAMKIIYIQIYVVFVSISKIKKISNIQN